MKRHTPLIALLGLTLLGAGALLPAHAAPPPQPQERMEQKGGKPSAHTQPAQSQQPQKQQPQQQQARPGQAQQTPPKDFSAVHQAFHERRSQIGRGPALPPNVHVRQGQPLPKGYGKRLDAKALHGLPRYEGYEWRRVGSDIVLIAVTTGIVYTILQGVLN